MTLLARRFSLRKIKEVLRLRFAIGLSGCAQSPVGAQLASERRVELLGDSIQKNWGKPNT